MLQRRAARVKRAALGLLDPKTRPAYLEAARRGGHRPPPRYTRIPRPTPGPETACAICGHTPVERIDVGDRQAPERVMTLESCPACGHVANPGNTFDYREYRSADSMTMGPRIGTENRQGREYHMARMAVEILGRPDLDVLVFGAGRSLDNHHIESLGSVRSVAIADIMRVRDDAPFVQADQPPSRRYDVVVACEVIEHFLDPHRDFAHLFSFVENDGLLVCSTNIMNGSDLTRQQYPFFRGHVSLYSPSSLGLLARENGYLYDFRLPLVATGFAGPHKRYILLTRSASVIGATAEYFGAHTFAPSDPP